MQIKYEAFDGNVFAQEKECIEYENQVRGVYEAALFIKQFCLSKRTCASCPFNRAKEEDNHFLCYFKQNCPDAWKLPNELK